MSWTVSVRVTGDWSSATWLSTSLSSSRLTVLSVSAAIAVPSISSSSSEWSPALRVLLSSSSTSPSCSSSSNKFSSGWVEMLMIVSNPDQSSFSCRGYNSSVKGLSRCVIWTVSSSSETSSADRVLSLFSSSPSVSPLLPKTSSKRSSILVDVLVSVAFWALKCCYPFSSISTSCLGISSNHVADFV